MFVDISKYISQCVAIRYHYNNNCQYKQRSICIGGVMKCEAYLAIGLRTGGARFLRSIADLTRTIL
jgi:hypothetical protein